MKRITFLSALSALLFMGFSSNAKGTNSPDAKTTDAVAAPSETKTKSQAGDTYYWFDVTSDGSALIDPSGIPLSQGQAEQGECQGNNEDFCQRGYTEAQTAISGGKRVVNVAVTASAMEDHKQ